MANPTTSSARGVRPSHIPPLHPQPLNSERATLKGHAASATYTPKSSTETRRLRAAAENSLTAHTLPLRDLVAQTSEKDVTARTLVLLPIQVAINKLSQLSTVLVDLRENVVYTIKRERIPGLIKVLNAIKGDLSPSTASQYPSQPQKIASANEHKCEIRIHFKRAISDIIETLEAVDSAPITKNDVAVKEAVFKRIPGTIKTLKEFISDLSNRTSLRDRRPVHAANLNPPAHVTRGSRQVGKTNERVQAAAASQAALAAIATSQAAYGQEGGSTELPRLLKRRDSLSISPNSSPAVASPTVTSSKYVSPPSGEEETPPSAATAQPARARTGIARPTAAASAGPAAAVPSSRAAPSGIGGRAAAARPSATAVERSTSSAKRQGVIANNSDVNQDDSDTRILEIVKKFLREYWSLRRQITDPEMLQKEKQGLLKRYCFYELRESYWDMTKWLGLNSPLISCFEDDLSDKISDDTVKISFNKLADQFSIMPDSVKATRLQLFVIITEVWTNSYNRFSLPVNRVLINTIKANMLDVCSKYARESDIGLNYMIAQEALKFFSMNKPVSLWLPKINNLAYLISRDVRNQTDESFKKLWSHVDQIAQDFVDSHPIWYIKLCAIRKAIYALCHHSDKLKLLQLCLMVNPVTVSDWYLVGGLLQMIGQLALETDNLRLKHDALMGQRLSVNAHYCMLKGFYHFLDADVRGIGQGGQTTSIKNYLRHLSYSYATRMIHLLPSTDHQFPMTDCKMRLIFLFNISDLTYHPSDARMEEDFAAEMKCRFSLPESPRAANAR